MLEATNVSIAFGGVRALQDVSIAVEPGQIVGLVGPNGAGKSTLFNCIAGIIEPSAGQIALDGVDILSWPTHRRARKGLSRTFQTPRADSESTVLDAIMTGCTVQMRQTTVGALFATRQARQEEKKFRARALELMEQFNLGNEKAIVQELPIAHLRLMEVVRAIAGDTRYLLLDEPAAGTDENDRKLLESAIHGVAANGCGVLLVEHNFAFVLSLCSSITVLSSGRMLLTGTPEEIRSSDEIATAYLGTAT